MEKEGEKEGMAKEKDRRKEDDRKRKTAAKVSFLKQYYPDTHSSPGGSIQILRHSNLNNILRTDGNGDRETGKQTGKIILSKKHLLNILANKVYLYQNARQKVFTWRKHFLRKANG